jgi:hypothetical protein
MADLVSFAAFKSCKLLPQNVFDNKVLSVSYSSLRIWKKIHKVLVTVVRVRGYSDRDNVPEE